MFSIGMVIIGILSVILPIAISILIIVAIVKAVQGNKQEDAFEKFENAIRSFYVYLVLICFLFCTIGSTVYLFNSGMNLLLPKKESTYSSYYDNYDTGYDTYSSDVIQSEPTTTLSSAPVISQKTTEKNISMVDLFTAMAFLGVSLTIFIYYSKVAKKDFDYKKEQKASEKV